MSTQTIAMIVFAVSLAGSASIAARMLWVMMEKAVELRQEVELTQKMLKEKREECWDLGSELEAKENTIAVLREDAENYNNPLPQSVGIETPDLEGRVAALQTTAIQMIQVTVNIEHQIGQMAKINADLVARLERLENK